MAGGMDPIQGRAPTDQREAGFNRTIHFGLWRASAARDEDGRQDDDPCPHRASVTARSRDPGDREPAAGDLSNRDLAGAVKRLSADRHTNKEIEAICNLKEWQVAAYRAVERFPPFLRERLNTADMRALYDLFRQWGHTPDEIEAAMSEADTYITVAEARRIIGRITGKPTGSIVIAREEQAAALKSAPVEPMTTAEEMLPSSVVPCETSEDGSSTVQDLSPSMTRPHAEKARRTNRLGLAEPKRRRDRNQPTSRRRLEDRTAIRCSNVRCGDCRRRIWATGRRP